jgi:hypothetical protein
VIARAGYANRYVKSKIEKERILKKSLLEIYALAVEVSGGLVWFWIGSHSDYDKMMG